MSSFAHSAMSLPEPIVLAAGAGSPGRSVCGWELRARWGAKPVLLLQEEDANPLRFCHSHEQAVRAEQLWASSRITTLILHFGYFYLGRRGLCGHRYREGEHLQQGMAQPHCRSPATQEQSLPVWVKPKAKILELQL